MTSGRLRTTRLAHAPALLALTASVVACGLFLALFAAAVLSSPGQRADGAGFALLAAPDPVLQGLARLSRALLPVLVGGGLTVAVVAAARRREWSRVLIAVGLPLVVLGLATALRDAVLLRPYLGANGYLHNTFPSAHTATLTAAVVGVAILLAAPRARRTRATLAVVVVVTCWANVATMAHRPSDVLGALLLVGAVAPWAVWAARRTGHGAQPTPESTKPK